LFADLGTADTADRAKVGVCGLLGLQVRIPPEAWICPLWVLCVVR